MLTPLPQLFSPQFIHADATLEQFALLARRQLRRVKLGVWATIAVALASALPELQGPGPLQTLAAKTWPAAFGGLYTWSETPTQVWEIMTTGAILGVFAAVCAAESRRLHAFLRELKPLDIHPAEREIFLTYGPDTQAVRYLHQAEALRRLRTGDWRLAIAMLHQQFPDLP
jgi:hypothetical protein